MAHLTKTFQANLKPNKETREQLKFISRGCSFVYNYFLNQRIEIDKQGKRQPTKEQQTKELTELKKQKEHEWLNKICAWTLQEIIINKVSNSWQKYRDRKAKYPKVSYPRMKTDKGWHDSFSVYQDGYQIKDNQLFLSQGKWENKHQSKIIVPFELTNPLQGTPKIINISWKNNNWTLNIASEIELPPKLPKSEIKRVVGIDRGVRKLFTTNEGWKYYSPKYWNKIRKRVVELQQILSRKVKGGNNWKKVKDELRRICQRISNRMKDRNHKLSRKLVNNYDLMVLEKLESSKMVNKKNKKVGRWTRDEMLKSCWYQLATFITYKAKGAGKWVEFVSPYQTSKKCSKCGEVNKKLKDEEVFVCPYCEYKEDRDINASKNILEKGLKKLRLGTSLA